MQEFQALPQIPAGHLPGAGLHINIAADAVQVERERVFKRLDRVFAK
jgi:hypothetical protein